MNRITPIFNIALKIVVLYYIEEVSLMKVPVLDKIKGTVMERLFFINNQLNEPLYMSLYHTVKEEIRKGRLKPDERLPSIRQLAKDMNLSRTTVENAFSQLLSEGYIYSKPQVGYYVMPLEHMQPQHVIPKEPSQEIEGIESQHAYDFVKEQATFESFDMNLWRRSITKAMSLYEHRLFSASHPLGEKELREQICDYFSRVRGVQAEPAQIIVGAGSATLMRILARLFQSDGLGYKYLLVENPGFNQVKWIFHQSDYSVKPIDLREGVLDASQLPSLSGVLYTSPSYQFPFGATMPIKTRLAILEWAISTRSYIIEDDYNNELQYMGKPVPSLQGIDGYERVIYMGSFSTLLLPSIRISFMVVPKSLLTSLIALNRDRTQTASKLEQLALATMIESGDLAKHVRRIRKDYRKKNRYLEELLEAYIAPITSYRLPPAGLNVIIDLPKPVAKRSVMDAFQKAHIGVALMSNYEWGNVAETETSIVLNYRGISYSELKQGLLIIKEILCRIQ